MAPQTWGAIIVYSPHTAHSLHNRPFTPSPIPYSTLGKFLPQFRENPLYG